MLLFTLATVIVFPLFVESFGDRFLGRVWPPLRWALVPTVGAATGAIIPIVMLPMTPGLDIMFSMFLGTVTGTLVALEGGFRTAFWSAPDEKQVAATGMRSYVRGKPVLKQLELVKRQKA